MSSASPIDAIPPLGFEDLRYFVTESNRIEGILGEPSDEVLQAHLDFLDTPLSIGSLCAFVSACQPDAKLRTTAGMNVYVGNHFPPPGGTAIGYALEHILQSIADDLLDPHDAHIAYETLHPFTDCNGRSGRALFLHHVRTYATHAALLAVLRVGFLHIWYYQTLQHAPSRQ